MVSIIGTFIRTENTGESYLDTGIKNLLIRPEEDATIVEARIKKLDKNCDEIFEARTV
jgi:hypothetical protein